MQKKILFFTKNWLGDVLFELPAIQAVKNAYPKAHIACLIHERCVPVIQSVPFIDEIIPYEENARHRGFFGHLRLILELQKHDFDTVFLFHRSSTRALVTMLAGIPKRIGYNTKGRSLFLTQAVGDVGQESMHHVDYFAYLIRQAGISIPAKPSYEFFFSQQDDKEAQHLLKKCDLTSKPFVIFNPGANWEPKRWSTAYFAELGKRLAQVSNIPIVITGHEKDEVLAREIQNQAPDVRWVSLCGKTSIRVLAALLSRAQWVVTADSGPMHFAAGVTTPVVALFGPTSPERTGPRGKGKAIVVTAQNSEGKKGWQCEGKEREQSMQWIQPEQVWQTIQQSDLLSLCKIEKSNRTASNAF